VQFVIYFFKRHFCYMFENMGWRMQLPFCFGYTRRVCVDMFYILLLEYYNLEHRIFFVSYFMLFFCGWQHIDLLPFLQQNKQILIDAVVHAVNEDYAEMANDFTRLGFLSPGTDVTPIIPALEAIWQNSAGKGLSDFNFRSVTGKHLPWLFNINSHYYNVTIWPNFQCLMK